MVACKVWPGCERPSLSSTLLDLVLPRCAASILELLWMFKSIGACQHPPRCCMCAGPP